MTTKDDEDRRELRTSATPQQVWEAWAKPEIIAGWFADRASGTPEKGSTITHVFEAFGMEIPYQVVEAIPGESIVFDSVGPGGQPFRQQVRVRKDGGETVLELVHSGFNDESWGEEFEGVDSGWALALAVLKHYLEHHFGRPRTTWLRMRPAAFDYTTADAHFRSRAGLAAWLTNGEGAVGDVGDAVHLALRNGHTVTGRVLAWSGREAAVSWDEVQGVLELKAFGAGDRTMLGLRAMSWAEAPPESATVEAWMDASLEALAAALTTSP
ncbi:MAG: SRPBCC domain-containing protein [Myxococcota bacterium]